VNYWKPCIFSPKRAPNMVSSGKARSVLKTRRALHFASLSSFSLEEHLEELPALHSLTSTESPTGSPTWHTPHGTPRGSTCAGAKPCCALLGMLGASPAACLEPLRGHDPNCVFWFGFVFLLCVSLYYYVYSLGANIQYGYGDMYNF